jgi:hypothetical protein
MHKTREMLYEEAQICQNCPYPKCKGDWGNGCAHYRAKMKEIKEKYRKEKKKNEGIKRNLKPTTQAV